LIIFVTPVSGADRKKKRKKVPKGYSSYQSAWIVDSDEDEDEEDGGEGEDEEDDQGSMDLDGGEKGKEHADMGMDGSEHSNDEGGDDDDEEDDEDDGEEGWTEDGDGTEAIDMEAAELYVTRTTHTTPIAWR
jgi:pre-rRNA-processing protein TSR1